MAGIFPEAGTSAANTFNGASPVNVVQGCDALFYRSNCTPVFDPIATNALISEIVNAVNISAPYDCSRLDNLKNAILGMTKVCAFPLFPGADVAPDVDSLAGCFDSENGRLTITDLAEIIRQINSLCSRQVSVDIKDTDFVIACIDGEEKKVPYSALKAVVIGNDFSLGQKIFGKGTESSVNSGSFTVPNNQEAFVVTNVTRFPSSNGVGTNQVTVGYSFNIGPSPSTLFGFNGQTVIKRAGDNWIGRSTSTETWQIIQSFSEKTFYFWAGQFSGFNVFDALPIGA